MREKYEEELRKLNTAIITMGKMIEIAIESSMLALMRRDIQAAEQVAKNDETINEMERIGDHATNIAEWVIFALTGERR